MKVMHLHCLCRYSRQTDLLRIYSVYVQTCSKIDCQISKSIQLSGVGALPKDHPKGALLVNLAGYFYLRPMSSFSSTISEFAPGLAVVAISAFDANGGLADGPKSLNYHSNG